MLHDTPDRAPAPRDKENSGAQTKRKKLCLLRTPKTTVGGPRPDSAPADAHTPDAAQVADAGAVVGPPGEDEVSAEFIEGLIDFIILEAQTAKIVHVLGVHHGLQRGGRLPRLYHWAA